ncbi:MAG TPA: hypothetical protein VMH27_14855 [Puia sp.]|nr:hypothetical protein [Puia sp.]
MKTKFTILFTIGLLFAAVATQAQTPGADRRDIRHDRVDIRHDRRDLVRDRQEGRFFDARHDRRDIRFDRQDLRHDRRDLYRDRNRF